MWVDFMLRAAGAGLGVALAAGLLGVFVVWRRMAYFGDATAHAALLGVALALGLSISVFGGVLAVSVAMALLTARFAGRAMGVDTVLGVLSHGALAFGLVAMAVLPGAQVNVEAYLFGDILAVRPADLWVIWGGAGAVAGLVLWRWRRLLTATLGADLAYSEGIDPRREQLVLTLALALVVAVAIKVVGALLITAMLVIPAGAARGLARSPEAMAAWAVALGALSVLGGLVMAWHLDTPAGPSVICLAAGLFVLTRLASRGASA